MDKDDTSQLKTEKENTKPAIKADKTKKKKHDYPKGFRFLFILIVVTWLFLGLEIMVNSLSSQNTKSIADLSNHNSNEIKKLNDNDKYLLDKIISSDKEIKDARKEIDAVHKSYLKQINKGDDVDIKENMFQNISSSESNDEKINSLKNENEKLSEQNISDKFEVEVLKKKINDQGQIIELKDSVISAIKLKNNFQDKSFAELYSSSLSKLSDKYENLSLSYQIRYIEKYAKDESLNAQYLKDQFSDLIEKIKTAQLEYSKNDSLLSKISYKSSGFIKISKSDSNDSLTQIESSILDAKKYVKDSKFAKAIDSMKKLDNKFDDLTASWIREAKIYVKANNAVDKITEKLNDQIKILESANNE